MTNKKGAIGNKNKKSYSHRYYQKDISEFNNPSYAVNYILSQVTLDPWLESDWQPRENIWMNSMKNISRLDWKIFCSKAFRMESPSQSPLLKYLHCYCLPLLLFLIKSSWDECLTKAGVHHSSSCNVTINNDSNYKRVIVKYNENCCLHIFQELNVKEFYLIQTYLCI